MERLQVLAGVLVPRALLGADDVVELLDVADPLRGQHADAPLHLGHRPLEHVGGDLGVGHHRGEQVGDVLVDPELEPLGVDQDEPHLVRGRPEEDRRDHAVEADALPGAGGAGDQEVGHRGEVGDPGVAVDRLAEAQGEAARGAPEGVRLEQLAEVDGVPLLVRDLDADVALPAHPVDADGLGLEGEREVVREAHDLRVLDAGVGLELVGGDHGPGVDLLHGAHDPELAALRLQDAALLEEAVVVDDDGPLRLVEDRDRGEGVAPAHLPDRLRGLAAPGGGPGPRLLVLVRRGRDDEGQRLLGGGGGRGARGRRCVQGQVVVGRPVGVALVGVRPGLHLTDAGQPASLGVLGRGVLADDVPAELLLALALAVVGPGGLQRPQPLAHPQARALEERRERELRGQDEGHEEGGRGEDVGAGPAEVRHEEGGQDLPDRAAGAHRLALEAHRAEDEGEEAGQGEQQQQVADRLRVGGVDRLAPEELPAEQPEHDREQHRGDAEQLRDQHLREEGAEGADEVARRAVDPGLEEGRGVARVERGQGDQQHQGDREGDEPQELRAARRSRLGGGHGRPRPPSPRG